MKKERGITLVALVITVIIMLILAGVALSLITGEEGLFARANHTTSLYKDASQTEAERVNQLLNGEYGSGGTTQPPTVSEPTLITELAKNKKLKVGDYIEYDAGNWTDADLAKIRNSTGKPTVTGSKDNPTAQGQFGGFEIGDSRNSNSTPYDTSYTPRTSGWRIWDIDESTGEVTIIHAGHPETYYHKSGKSAASINILRNRDCSMYENKYAKENSAHFLMGWEAAEWYTKNCLTDEERTSGLVYELESYDEDVDKDENSGERSFYSLSNFVLASDNPVIEVLENGSLYWVASAYSTISLFYVDPSSRTADSEDDRSYGVRPLVILKTNILLKQDGQTDGEWNQWKITGVVTQATL